MQSLSNHTFTANSWFLESVWNEFASYSSTTTWHIYGPSGLIATHTGSSSIEFPLKDHLGSPRVVVKQTLNKGTLGTLSVSGRYSWHPFGGLLQTEGNGELDYGFTGQEKDHELGLHNPVSWYGACFRARQYTDDLF
jgi:hypothetical protein